MIRTLDNYSLEELIINEDSIDWEAASLHTKRDLSLAEIRLFRSKIKWNLYFLTTRNMPYDHMKCASKYFNSETYRRIALFNSATEEFIIENKDNFNWEILIKNSRLSEDTLLKCYTSWERIR